MTKNILVYSNVIEVIRAEISLLENEETKAIALRNAIQEGLNSPGTEDFDFDENHKKTKIRKKEKWLNLS